MKPQHSNRGPKWLKIGNFNIKIERTSKQALSALGLAPREIIFLKLLAQGYCLKGIAREMQISPHTADTYKRRVYAKLGVNSAVSAALIAAAHYVGAEIECDYETKPDLRIAA